MSVGFTPISDASDPLDWSASEHNDMTIMQAKFCNTCTQVAKWFGLVCTAPPTCPFDACHPCGFSQVMWSFAEAVYCRGG